MKKGLLPKIIISLLGVGLIFMGLFQTILGFVGESASAVITNIRREGGERADSVPGRYTYNISYTFTLPNGNVIDGFAKQIKGAVYVKADGTSSVRVRYFPIFPYINAMEHDTGLGAGQIVLIAAGVFLIFVMNKKKRKKGVQKQKPHEGVMPLRKKKAKSPRTS